MHVVRVVIVRVMQIRSVVVVVNQPGMLVDMRMLADERWLVRVVVMTVVVAVHVVVRDRLVDVRVAMALGEVQVHTDGKQRCRAQRPCGQRASAEPNGDRCAQERRHREYRAGARGADRALRKQVQPQ